MRKVFPLFLFAVFWILPAGAQNPPIPITTLTASGSSCVSGSTTAGSFLIVNITPAQGVASFTINANAGSNTISFYASGDGGKTYVPLSVTPSNSTTTVTTTTSTGVWRASVAGYTNVCMLESTKSSGNTLVNIAPSTASALGLGGGGGGVTSITGDGTIITNSSSTGAVTLTADTHTGSGSIVLATSPSLGGVSTVGDGTSSLQPLIVNGTSSFSSIGFSRNGSADLQVYEDGTSFGTATGGGTFLLSTTISGGNSQSRGTFTAPNYLTATNCIANGTAANPSVVSCSASAAGMFSCSTTATTGTCQVNTTAVTANSEINITPNDADGGMSQLNVTCNTTLTTPAAKPILLSKSAGASFTINLGTVTANPACYEYIIVN